MLLPRYINCSVIQHLKVAACRSWFAAECDPALKFVILMVIACIYGHFRLAAKLNEKQTCDGPLSPSSRRLGLMRHVSNIHTGGLITLITNQHADVHASVHDVLCA